MRLPFILINCGHTILESSTLRNTVKKYRSETITTDRQAFSRILLTLLFFFLIKHHAHYYYYYYHYYYNFSHCSVVRDRRKVPLYAVVLAFLLFNRDMQSIL